MRTALASAACTVLLFTGVALAAPAGAAPATSAPTAPTWTPPPGALPDGPSAFYLVEEPWEGYGGSTATTTNDRSDISVLGQTTRVVVNVQGDHDTSLMFDVPSGTDLQPGFFDYPVDGDATLFYLHDSSSCADHGWVEVTAADTTGGTLQHLELTFEVVCDANGGPQVRHGALRWDASAPLGSPNPIDPIPDGLWAPPTDAMPTTPNAAYVESGIVVIDGVTATGTGVSGYDDTRDPDDIRGDDWRFAFGEPGANSTVRGTIEAGRHDDALRVGLYADLLDTGVNGVTGGFGLSYGSNAAGSCPSWFAIDELTRSNGHIDHIAFRFEHDCSPLGPVTHGAVRWTATPSITGLFPNHGISRGGATVRVEGVDLVDVSAVTVGGVSASVSHDDYTGVTTFEAPALPVGDHEVRITAAGGTAVGSGEIGFTATPDTPTAPASVTVTPAAARALLEWQPPADLGAGTITGIRLDLYRWSNQSEAPPDRTMTVAPTDTVALWGELWPGYTYRFKVTYLSDLGPGVTWDSSTYYRIPDADVTPFDEVPTLVVQQYVDFAGRAPTAAERNAAVADIRSGTTLPGTYVATMRNRAEWGGVRGPMTRLYASYFDRLPDAGGLTWWSGKLRSGTSLAKASATFAASSEFTRKYGSLSNGAFVDLVYRNVLHRAADPSGRTHWIRKLNAGASRGSVMASFSESSEHVRTMAPTVDAVLLYTGMLRRMPTKAELASATGADPRRALAVTAAAPEVLAEQLRHSPAYAARF